MKTLQLGKLPSNFGTCATPLRGGGDILWTDWWPKKSPCCRISVFFLFGVSLSSWLLKPSGRRCLDQHFQALVVHCQVQRSNQLAVTGCGVVTLWHLTGVYLNVGDEALGGSGDAVIHFGGCSKPVRKRTISCKTTICLRFHRVSRLAPQGRAVDPLLWANHGPLSAFPSTWLTKSFCGYVLRYVAFLLYP